MVSDVTPTKLARMLSWGFWLLLLALMFWWSGGIGVLIFAIGYTFRIFDNALLGGRNVL